MVVSSPLQPIDDAPNSPSGDEKEAVRAAWELIAPLWTLRNFVAVNPYAGFTDHSFGTAVGQIDRIFHARCLMPVDYYRRKYREGEIVDADLQEVSEAEDTSASRAVDEARVRTYAEGIDHRHGQTTWSELIESEISKWCAARFDLGQAAWRMPWRDASLWSAWRETAAIDRSPESLGLEGFRKYVGSLPANADRAIRVILDDIGVPPESWRDFCGRALASVRGWAGHIRYLAREGDMRGEDLHDLERDFLAVRLAYEGAVHSSVALETGAPPPKWSDMAEPWLDTPNHAEERGTALHWQAAFEASFRRRLLGELQVSQTAGSFESKPVLQAVFCIDVRSEIFRRHLEATSPTEVQTIGFAGFFGFPLEWIPFGDEVGGARCPVLISPAFKIQETISDNAPLPQSHAKERKFLERLRHRSFLSARLSSVSSFSIAETVGLWFGLRLLTDSLQITHPLADGAFFKSKLEGSTAPELEDIEGFGLEQKVAVSEGALRGMGLVDNFSEIVLFCGHGSQTANNPYGSGLDCGACGGHAGDANAKVAARVMNDPEVRKGLAQRGIHIPDTTRFVAGIHRTTTDEVDVFETEGLGDRASWLKGILEHAGAATRRERMEGLCPGASEAKNPFDEVRKRSRDWSEVRPEWGLARNAAFIAARRSRTRNVALDGRVFLHDYDPAKDPENAILTVIMTAPMVVAHWINMQYYASTVDNDVFGSGNKVLHNVVGRHGVMEGNRSDLRTGLPYQSVYGGTEPYHEPLRLQVFLEASEEAIDGVIEQHEGVRSLADNGWVNLISWTDEGFRLRLPGGTWRPLRNP